MQIRTPEFKVHPEVGAKSAPGAQVPAELADALAGYLWGWRPARTFPERMAEACNILFRRFGRGRNPAPFVNQVEMQIQAVPLEGSGVVIDLATLDGKVMFSFTLEGGAQLAVAEACARSIGGLEWRDLWKGPTLGDG